MTGEDRPAADEFDIIARCFAPLAEDKAARGLLDDVAVWSPPAGALALTADAIVEGVHFLPGDPIATVAQKALRVNLSDLAAKAARPLGYLLTLAWPNTRPAAEIADFARGLAADQARFGLTLLGGDTVATPGPLTVSITMIGSPRSAAAPTRSNVQPGDDLWVTGVIGDGWLGLQAAQGGCQDLAPAHRDALIGCYRTPEPRLDCAELIATHANASMDVSDGLLADAGKLAGASKVALTLSLVAMPTSPAGEAWLAGQPDATLARLALATGGDDYQLLFSAPPARRAAIAALGLAVRIGFAGEGAGLTVVGPNGPLAPGLLAAGPQGFAHRLGR